MLTVIGFAARQQPVFEDGRLLWSIAYLGLLASGLAFSLRLRTPNLAVPGAATLSMVAYGGLTLGGGTSSVVAALVVAGPALRVTRVQWRAFVDSVR